VDVFKLADAKAHLSELVDRVEAGDTMAITRRGRPTARSRPATSSSPSRPRPSSSVGATWP